MRNKRATTPTMARLLENARYEVLPTASTEDKVLAHVPADADRHGDRLARARGSGRRSTSPSA